MNDLEKMSEDLASLRGEIDGLSQKVSRLSQRVNIIFDTLMRETNHSMCSLLRDDEGEPILGNNGLILQPNGEIK